MQEELDHNNLRVTTKKFPSDYRKNRYELVDKSKNNPVEFLYAKDY